MRLRTKINYIIGIIALAGFAALTYYSQTISPTLLTFFGFVLAYMIAVFVFFLILGRYGA